MTLERLTERLQEEDDKVGKVDGRRFNSRSRKKMKWEMRNIEKSIFTNERRKHSNMRRALSRDAHTRIFRLVLPSWIAIYPQETAVRRVNPIVIPANHVLFFFGSRYAHAADCDDKCKRVAGWVCASGHVVTESSGGDIDGWV